MKVDFLRTLMFLLAIVIAPIAHAIPNYWQESFNQGFSDYEIRNAENQGFSIVCNTAAGEDDEHRALYSPDVKQGDWLDLSDEDYAVLINDTNVVYVPESTNHRLGAGGWIELTSLIEEATDIKVYQGNDLLAVFNPRNLSIVEGLSDGCTPLMYKDFS